VQHVYDVTADHLIVNDAPSFSDTQVLLLGRACWPTTSDHWADAGADRHANCARLSVPTGQLHSNSNLIGILMTDKQNMPVPVGTILASGSRNQLQKQGTSPPRVNSPARCRTNNFPTSF
jgi:hypothetical protein